MRHFDRIKIGEKFQRIRKEKGLVLRDLVCSELSLTTLSRIEQGYPLISLQKYELYADKLDENLEDLLNKESLEDTKREILKWRLHSIEHHLDLGDADHALKELKELKCDIPSLQPATHFLRGKCFLKVKKWQRAKKEFAEAIRIATNNSQADLLNIPAVSYNDLSMVYYFEENLVNALDATEKGIQHFNPHGERIYIKKTLEVNKAAYLVDLQKFWTAKQLLEKLVEDGLHLIQTVSARATACELLARVYLHYKQYSEAIHYALKGLEIGRSNHLYDQTFELWNILGILQTKTGQEDLAETSFKTALGFRDKLRYPQIAASTFTEMGSLYINKKDWDSAQQAISEAMKIGETTKGLRYIESLIALGDLHTKKKNYDEAIKPYEKALSLCKEQQLHQKETDILMRLCKAWEFVDRLKFLNCLEMVYKSQKNLVLE